MLVDGFTGGADGSAAASPVDAEPVEVGFEAPALFVDGDALEPAGFEPELELGDGLGLGDVLGLGDDPPVGPRSLMVQPAFSSADRPA